MTDATVVGLDADGGPQAPNVPVRTRRGIFDPEPMPDLPPAAPHDALFRALLADPGRAETLVREYLPPSVAAELSDAPIRPVDASFVDAVLHRSHSDRLFEARLKGGGTAFVYVLLEHKAAPDPGTPLQMLGYMVRIWQRYAEGRASRLRALPPIVPLIFYHGRERWSGALSVAETIAGEGEVAAFARRLCCVLHDLGERPLTALSRDPAVWSGLAALVAAFRGQPEEGVLRRILSGLPDGSELELQVLSYIVRTYELTPAVLETAARAAKSQRWEALMSTVAEAWVREGEAKGRAEGKAQGRAEGKAETLLRLLQRRFGPVPASARSRVAVGSAAEIDAWLDALLDAQSLTDVFDARPH